MTGTAISPVQRFTALAVILLGVAVLLGASAFVHYRKASALSIHGVGTSADVVEVTQRSKAGVTTGYLLHVEFEANEVPVRASLLPSRELGQRFWDESESGPVRIIYLPDDPSFAVLADPNERSVGHSDAIERYVGFLVALPVALAGFWCLLLRRRHIRRGMVK